MQGYKVIADENANPGKYGFRIIHDSEPSHFFSSEEQMVIREWMKALMKATIDRDFSSMSPFIFFVVICAQIRLFRTCRVVL